MWRNKYSVGFASYRHDEGSTHPRMAGTFWNRGPAHLCFRKQWPPTDIHNVLAVRHDKGADDPTKPNWGKGAANFVDGHAEPVSRIDAMTLKFYNLLAQ